MVDVLDLRNSIDVILTIMRIWYWMLSLKAHRTFIRMTACVLKVYFRPLNRRLFASGRSWRPSELWPFRHISFGGAQKWIPESVQIVVLKLLWLDHHLIIDMLTLRNDHRIWIQQAFSSSLILWALPNCWYHFSLLRHFSLNHEFGALMRLIELGAGWHFERTDYWRVILSISSRLVRHRLIKWLQRVLLLLSIDRPKVIHIIQLLYVKIQLLICLVPLLLLYHTKLLQMYVLQSSLLLRFVDGYKFLGEPFWGQIMRRIRIFSFWRGLSAVDSSKAS